MIEPLTIPVVMPGLVPGIHVLSCKSKRVDGRDKPGHDGVLKRSSWQNLRPPTSAWQRCRR
nr:hypothetical protein FNV92_12035 [Bradyrhizobium cosmicum]